MFVIEIAIIGIFAKFSVILSMADSKAITSLLDLGVRAILAVPSGLHAGHAQRRAPCALPDRVQKGRGKTLPGMPRAGNVQSPAQTASAAVPLPLLPPQGLKGPET